MSWEALILRPRLVISFVLAVILGLLLPASLPIWSKCLIAWCFGVTVYMALVTTELSRATLDKIRESASRLDDSAPVILVVSMAATAQIARRGGRKAGAAGRSRTNAPC